MYLSESEWSLQIVIMNSPKMEVLFLNFYQKKLVLQRNLHCKLFSVVSQQ